MSEAGAWMPMYWGDYFKHTLHFTNFQHACYLLLIGAYWCNGGPIPDDPEYLAQVCRTTLDKLSRFGKPVIAKFTSKDGLLHHERIDLEILRSSNRQAAATANGRAGGLAKSKLITVTSTKEKKYRFHGKVLRLTEEDYERWHKAYSYLNGTFDGLLESRDVWLAEQPIPTQKRAFVSTAAWLANKNAEAASKTQPKRVVDPARVAGTPENLAQRIKDGMA